MITAEAKIVNLNKKCFNKLSKSHQAESGEKQRTLTLRLFLLIIEEVLNDRFCESVELLKGFKLRLTEVWDPAAF